MGIYKYIISMLMLLNLMFLVACVDNNDISTPIIPENDDMVSIEIFTRSQNYQLPVTRATGAQENEIEKTPYVLVFEVGTGTLICVEIARTVEHTGTVKRYVQLTKRDGTFRFLILANNQTHFYFDGERYEFNETNLKTYILGRDMADINGLFLTDKLDSPLQTIIPYTTTDWSSLLPMSCLTEPVNGINESTKIGEAEESKQLELKRVVAKISFMNDPVMKDKDTPYYNFDMLGLISINNTPQQSKIYNYDGEQLTNEVDLTEVALDEQYSDVLFGMEHVDESLEWYTPCIQVHWGSPCYVNETAASKNTYFIIKGILTADYGSGTEEPRTYYYKMAAIDGNQKPMDFKRNVNYEFKIKNVRGPGYETVSEAMAAPAANKTILDFEVTTTDLSSHHIITNGNYYLGVTNSRYITYTDEPGVWHHAFSIITDYFDNDDAPRSVKNEITAISSSDDISCDVSTIPETMRAPQQLDVSVKFNNNNAQGRIEIWLGNLQLIVYVEHRNILPATANRLDFYRYYKNPSATNEAGETVTQQHWEYGYYLISGTVDDTDASWIKLAAGSNDPPEAAVNYTSGGAQYFSADPAKLTNVTDAVTSGHGKIQVYIDKNETGVARPGTFYLSTGLNPGYFPQNKVERIKFDIKQDK